MMTPLEEFRVLCKKTLMGWSTKCLLSHCISPLKASLIFILDQILSTYEMLDQSKVCRDILKVFLDGKRGTVP